MRNDGADTSVTDTYAEVLEKNRPLLVLLATPWLVMLEQSNEVEATMTWAQVHGRSGRVVLGVVLGMTRGRGDGEGIHTFSLGHERKTSFGVLGRGHLGILGGGPRSLSCSCHTAGW